MLPNDQNLTEKVHWILLPFFMTSKYIESCIPFSWQASTLNLASLFHDKQVHWILHPFFMTSKYIESCIPFSWQASTLNLASLFHDKQVHWILHLFSMTSKKIQNSLASFPNGYFKANHKQNVPLYTRQEDFACGLGLAFFLLNAWMVRSHLHKTAIVKSFVCCVMSMKTGKMGLTSALKIQPKSSLSFNKLG